MISRFPSPACTVPLFSAIFILFLFSSPGFAIRNALAQTATPAPVAWKAIAPDLDFLQIPVGEGLLATSVTFVRSGLERFRIGVLRAAEFGEQRLNVETLCQDGGAVACVNANFFDEFGKPLGVVVSRGTSFSPLHQGGSTLTGVFEAGRSYHRIVSRANYDGSSALEAIQAGPRLLLNQVVLRGIKDTNRSSRAGVCIDSRRRVIFYAFQSSLGGLTLQEVQALLTRRGLDCVDALNLDGGGSAQLYVQAPGPNTSDNPVVSMRGFDPVPVALALFERQRDDTDTLDK